MADNVRHGLCSDLGFSDADRKENIRRIGETDKLMLESGTIVLTAFISPFREDRESVRNIIPHGDFIPHGDAIQWMDRGPDNRERSPQRCKHTQTVAKYRKEAQKYISHVQNT